jgi:hypothetical protein
MEAVTCGWLAFVVVVTLAAQWLVGAWWIDSVGSLAIVWLLVKEGREAWLGDECGSCCQTLEQKAEDKVIRSRARYTGPAPERPAAHVGEKTT